MKNYFQRSGLPVLVSAAIVTVVPSMASAQLEEVLVTAERREASVQDVPIAVSAYSEEMIERLQIDDTLDLINVVPNLFGGNNTGLGTANMYYLRAQGNDESISTFDPPVGTYVDDVYITRQNVNNVALFDVERIEVLRGPQGTLYGRNTTGGAISVVMKKPSDTMQGYVEAGAGNWGKTMVRGSIDLPLSENVLTKFSAYYVDTDGYLENRTDGKDYNEADLTGIRAALRWLISDSMTWDIAVDGGKSEVANIHGFLDGDDRYSLSVLGSGLPMGGGMSDYGNEVDTLNITSNLAWDAMGGTANLIFGSRSIEQDFLLNFPFSLDFFPDFFIIDNQGEHDMYSAELKWSGDIMDGRAFLQTGVYYMDEDNTVDFVDYLDLAAVGVPAPPSTAFLTLADRVLSNTTESFAVYAQADIKIGNNGTLTLGARYTDEEKTVDFQGTVNSAGMVAAGIPLSQSEQEITPRIAYAHKFTDNLMMYASATNGFKSGGWNARGSSSAALQAFAPETIWSYELGMRGDWMDGRLRTNITMFYSDLEDLQTTSATPDGQFLTTNAGGLEVPGIEAEITALPTDNWQIFAALGWQNAEYQDLPGGCVTPNADLAAYDADCNIAEPKRSPHQTYTLGTSVDFSLGGVTVTPNIMFRYLGSQYPGTRNSGYNESVTLLNAGVKLSMADSRWELNLECKNCGDKTYTQSFLFTRYYNLPVTYLATLKYRFGG
jgi:iron complex outermembrane receptor protein|tara:strand:+ start:977 stop:3133 length:2157 start_codon:yes stop_codon:yes gene_type:complete